MRKQRANGQDDNHQECAQAAFKCQSADSRRSERSGKTYSDVLKDCSKKGSNYAYSVPTKNMFNPLNC